MSCVIGDDDEPVSANLATRTVSGMKLVSGRTTVCTFTNELTISGNEEYVIRVTNLRAEVVTLDSLTDNRFDNINGAIECPKGGTIAGLLHHSQFIQRSRGIHSIAPSPAPLAFRIDSNANPNDTEINMSRITRIAKAAAVSAFAIVAFVACAHAVMMVKTPTSADTEFGYGPRASASGAYTATIAETAPYKVGKLLTTSFRLETKDGAAVTGANIQIGGGMPQHGHGLPTKPRVTREIGAGRYEIDGLKFNMGGWWELKLRINSGAQPDSVVFNLNL